MALLFSAGSVAGFTTAVVRLPCVTLTTSAEGRIAKLSTEQLVIVGDAVGYLIRILALRNARLTLLPDVSACRPESPETNVWFVNVAITGSVPHAPPEVLSTTS